MENSKEKEEVVEEVSVTKDQAETADGKVETVIEVDKKEVVSVEAESKTKTGKAVASAEEEVIETKEEVVVKSDGTTVVEEAEKITTIEDQAVITDDVSKGSSEVVVSEEKTEDIVAAAADAEVVVSEEKTEDIVAAAADAEVVPPGATPPKKLEEAESSSSNTKARESSGDVHDSAPKENPAAKGNNQEISENLRSNENQQSVDPAAPTRQTSSWTNCCGLFDLLKHSSHQ